MDEELLKLVVCPRDKQDLRQEFDRLFCPSGHRYRIGDGVPSCSFPKPSKPTLSRFARSGQQETDRYLNASTYRECGKSIESPGSYGGTLVPYKRLFPSAEFSTSRNPASRSTSLI